MKKIFENKTILITGGTGFLGKSLTKKLLEFGPRQIRLFSRDEVKHYKVQEEFKYDIRLRNLIGDVRDYERLKKAMKGVDYVFHVAALKRLDILEYNVDESVKTNILGTLNVVNACLETGVKKAIYISTDKACSPVNSYGACKFVGERIFIETNYSKGSYYPVFSVVRYGNVLESTGSVIPFFTSKIKNKEKIPLTDERMTRFIISPEQAVKLVIDAVRYGVGGDIFVPVLPAFKITDLIEILKEKYGASNEIKTIGIRPGEKIHELMINNAEIIRTYSYKDLYVIFSHLEILEDLPKIPCYIEGNKSLTEKDMVEYSSKDFVLDKEKVKKLLVEFGVI